MLQLFTDISLRLYLQIYFAHEAYLDANIATHQLLRRSQNGEANHQHLRQR